MYISKKTFKIEPKPPTTESSSKAIEKEENSSVLDADHEQDKGEQEETTEQTQSKAVKTEAELMFEEKKRKRLEERLRREGVKTHKERVEELNRYLSKLSEHHDMYVIADYWILLLRLMRIGPGLVLAKLPLSRYLSIREP